MVSPVLYLPKSLNTIPPISGWAGACKINKKKRTIIEILLFMMLESIRNIAKKVPQKEKKL